MLLCSFALLNGSFAQKLSDQQVIQMAVKEKQAGASETEIATRLMQKGATMDQIQRIRSQYAQQITKRGLDDTVDNASLTTMPSQQAAVLRLLGMCLKRCLPLASASLVAISLITSLSPLSPR